MCVCVCVDKVGGIKGKGTNNGKESASEPARGFCTGRGGKPTSSFKDPSTSNRKKKTNCPSRS